MVQWIRSHLEYSLFVKPDFQLRTALFYVPVLLGEGDPAVGITISRKVGKAVQRNLLKRRIKAWLHGNQLPTGIRINLVARIGAAGLSWQDLCTQLDSICRELRAIAR